LAFFAAALCALEAKFDFDASLWVKWHGIGERLVAIAEVAMKGLLQLVSLFQNRKRQQPGVQDKQVLFCRDL
jgi:hypothetical protein